MCTILVGPGEMYKKAGDEFSCILHLCFLFLNALTTMGTHKESILAVRSTNCSHHLLASVLFPAEPKTSMVTCGTDTTTCAWRASPTQTSSTASSSTLPTPRCWSQLATTTRWRYGALATGWKRDKMLHWRRSSTLRLWLPPLLLIVYRDDEKKYDWMVFLSWFSGYFTRNAVSISYVLLRDVSAGNH